MHKHISIPACILSILCFVCITSMCQQAGAVPAAPIIHKLVQPDGTVVRAVKWGDEHRSGWETEDGFAIRRDEKTGYWRYLMPAADGSPVLLNGRVGIEPPPAGLGRRIERQFKPLDIQPLPKRGLAQPQRAVPPAGTGNLVVILINFNDTSTTYTASNFNSLLFGTSTNSMKDYYEEVSYGKFTVSPGPGGVVGWYTAANPHDYYGENGVSGNDKWPGTLVREAIIAADAAGFDFSAYDQDNDSYVDQVAIVHQGTGEEASPNAYDIWSHSWDLDSAYLSGYSDGGAYTTNDGVIVNAYVIMPELYATGMSTMGVFAHEYGHALGLPDLYDTDGTSQGIGNWSLMAGGSWCYVTTPGDRPSHMDAWSKYALDWVTPTAVSGTLTDQTIQQAATVADVYQLRSGSPSTGGEYFLVENRQNVGFDAGLPGAGLLIWHINENKSNNNKECAYGPGSALCTLKNYKVALMQADNQWDMEKNINRGDDGDIYPGIDNNSAFTDSTAPSSKLWDRSASGVSVTAISISASTMTATLSYGADNTTTTIASTTTSTVSATTTAASTTTTTVVSSSTTSVASSSTTSVASSSTTSAASSTTTAPVTTTAPATTTTTTPIVTTTTTVSGRPCPATSVLGENNPDLEKLRALRDGPLAQSAIGRSITQIYYSNADSINAALERNPALRAVARKFFEAASLLR